MQCRQRYLGGTDQEEVVALNRVDLVAVGWKEPGAEQRLLPNQHRRNHGRESLCGQPVHRKPHQPQVEESRLAFQVGEARPG